jgi:hypothetical protein
MKIVFRMFIFTSILIFSSVVWGHGDAAHVMGTVTAIEADHVIVKTTKGQTLSLAFQPNTVFQQDGIHRKDARPQIGDRLVAEVTKKELPQNRDWVATAIKFATPKTTH